MQANLIPSYPSPNEIPWTPALPVLGMLPPRRAVGFPAAPTSYSAQEQFMVSAEARMQWLAGELLGLMTRLMVGVKSDSAAPTPSPIGGPSPSASPPSGGDTKIDDRKTGSTDFGKRLAQKAEATANRINTSGLCLKGVNDSMEAVGIKVNRRPSAYMALEDLRKDPHFQEAHLAKDKLDSLPAGAVVVWGKGSGLPDGHISVALGDGREASSRVCKQLHLSTEFHVFMPK